MRYVKYFKVYDSYFTFEQCSIHSTQSCKCVMRLYEWGSCNNPLHQSKTDFPERIVCWRTIKHKYDETAGTARAVPKRSFFQWIVNTIIDTTCQNIGSRAVAMYLHYLRKIPFILITFIPTRWPGWLSSFEQNWDGFEWKGFKIARYYSNDHQGYHLLAVSVVCITNRIGAHNAGSVRLQPGLFRTKPNSFSCPPTLFLELTRKRISSKMENNYIELTWDIYKTIMQTWIMTKPTSTS